MKYILSSKHFTERLRRAIDADCNYILLASKEGFSFMKNNRTASIVLGHGKQTPDNQKLGVTFAQLSLLLMHICILEEQPIVVEIRENNLTEQAQFIITETTIKI